MNNKLIEIAFVLDRSGSMSTIKTDTEGGFNTFIESQKKVEGDVKVSLYQFDTAYETVYNRVPLAEVKPLALVPRGGTALLDAIGKTITDVGKRLADTPEAERPAKVILVILTDGEENSSQEYTSSRIQEMIKHQTDVYSWEFVFIGANQDAIATASRLGIAKGNSITFAATSTGANAAFDTYSSKLTRSRTLFNSTACYVSSDFTEEERLKAEDKAE